MNMPSGEPMYVRMRCPVCGMWAFLKNVTRDHSLYEESAAYSGGRARISHTRLVNPNLKGFWVTRLLSVLKRMGIVVEVHHPYSYEDYEYEYIPKAIPIPVNYTYIEKGGSYPYDI